MPNDIFKKYDVRGLFPQEVNVDTARLLAKAYIVTFAPTKIVIGHDPLIGSNTIYDPVCEEFSKYGVEVYKAGEISTPLLYFASSHFGVPQGIILTASHLGTLYTGFKIVLNGVPPTQDKIIEMKENFHNQAKLDSLELKQIPRNHLTNLKAEYINKLIEIAGTINDPHKYKFAVDASNGPNAQISREIFNKLGFDYVMINEEIKSKDLAHETNPKVEKNRQELTDLVKKSNADLGIIWDGDCDRAYFIDNKGTIIPPEFVGITIGSYLITRKKGNTMTIDVRASNAVEKEINKTGGVVKRIQAWHVPIKFEMEKDQNIVFGMETSGHYVFRDLYKADDGLLASLVFLAAIYNSQDQLGSSLKEFSSKYKIVEEVNFTITKPETQIYTEIKQLYSDGKLSEIDGISIDYPTWRANIRTSKSEPILRLNISGTEWTDIDANFKKLKEIINGKIIE